MIKALLEKLSLLNAWIHKVLGVVNAKEFDLVRLVYTDSIQELARQGKTAISEIILLNKDIRELRQQLESLVNSKENKDGKATAE